MAVMSYEDYLNEITTLIYELYDVDEDEAVRLVVEAQDAEYFIPHDEKPELRTQENAERDAALIFESRA
ncbi:MAG: hypothetical protein WBO07_02575 [Formosimonas sp.]|jgi:hypothetical protein